MHGAIRDDGDNGDVEGPRKEYSVLASIYVSMFLIFNF